MRILLGISMLCLGLAAIKAATPEDVQLRWLPDYQLGREVTAAPGVAAYADTLSLSGATLGVESRDMGRAVLPQLGTGVFEVSIGAESYLHLDSLQTVWGGAGFSTGRIDDVKWTNSIDYPLIAPYVLGDGTGGDMDYRRYTFGGGYEYRLGRWSLGASVGYRAEIAWRDRDPRVRTVVSDLDFALGAGCRVIQRRFVGLSAGVRSYTQNCDLDFYNPLNDINTLPLTGFGTSNKRFAGNTNKNSGHTGTGFSAAVSTGTTDRRGLQLRCEGDMMRINLLLRNFNNITFAFTDTYRLSAMAAYVVCPGTNLKVIPTARVEIMHRLGTENLFGTAAGASYDKIGQQSPYVFDSADVNVSSPVEIMLANGWFTATPSLAWGRGCEKLSTARRQMEITHLTPGIAVQYSRMSGKWLCRVTGDYRFRHILSSDFKMPGADPVDPLQASVIKTYDMLSSPSQRVGGGICVSRAFGGIVAGLSADYSHLAICHRTHGHTLAIAANLCF